jgi:hypothetical protein
MRTFYGAAAGIAIGVVLALTGCGGTTVGTSVAPPSTTTAAATTTKAAVPSNPASATPTSAAPTIAAAPRTTAPVPVTTPPVAAPVAPPPAPAPVPPAQQINAEAVVTQYYQDITDHNYAAAWALGGANIAGESYAQYVAGFDTTASISLGTVSQFGSDQVSAVLYATQSDGSVKVFDGTYTVSGGVLVGAAIRQEY